MATATSAGQLVQFTRPLVVGKVGSQQLDEKGIDILGSQPPQQQQALCAKLPMLQQQQQPLFTALLMLKQLASQARLLRPAVSWSRAGPVCEVCTMLTGC